jgi:hypothetical protein
MKRYKLDIKTHKNDEFVYSFSLTLDDIIKLAFMPYKLRGTGNPGTASHVRLDKQGIDAYRLAEDFYILYDNKEKGSIHPNVKYSEIEEILKDAIDKIQNGKSVNKIYIESQQ